MLVKKENERRFRVFISFIFFANICFAVFFYTSSIALKIHISKATKDNLDKIGGYLMQERGSIDIKVCQ